MAPDEVGLVGLGTATGRPHRDGKLLLDEWHRGDEGLGPAGEEIEGDDPLERPGMEGDVALKQHAHTADSHRLEGVAVVR